MSRPYEVELLQRANKELDKLSRQQPKDAQAIEDAIADLAEDPAQVAAYLSRDRRECGGSG